MQKIYFNSQRFFLAIVLVFMGTSLLFSQKKNKEISSAGFSARTYYETGKKAHGEGKLEEAILAYSEAITLDPEMTNALYNRGGAYFSQSKLSKAKADFEAVLRVQPNDLDAVERRAATNYRLGEFSAAVKDYSVLINDHASADLYLNRGLALMEDKESTLAMEDFDRALRMDSKLPLAWAGRGECAYLGKKYEESAHAYGNAVQLQPNNQRFLYGHGIALIKTGKLKEAVVQLEKSYSIQTDAHTASSLAYCYFQLGEVAKAETLATQAHDLDVRCADAYNVLGLIAIGQRKYEYAEKLFLEAIHWEKNHTNAAFNLGYVYYLLQRYTEAQKLFNESITTDPFNGNAYYARASVRYMLEDKKGACSDYERAVEFGYEPFSEDGTVAFCE